MQMRHTYVCRKIFEIGELKKLDCASTGIFMSTTVTPMFCILILHATFKNDTKTRPVDLWVAKKTAKKK